MLKIELDIHKFGVIVEQDGLNILFSYNGDMHLPTER